MLPIQCATCRHYLRDLTCAAFPKGIPAKILTGEHDHSEPYPGDNGIRYEPKDNQGAVIARGYRGGESA